MSRVRCFKEDAWLKRMFQLIVSVAHTESNDQRFHFLQPTDTKEVCTSTEHSFSPAEAEGVLFRPQTDFLFLPSLACS